MFVDKDKPLPIPENKKDPLGELLNSFIKVERERDKLQGDASNQYNEIQTFKTNMRNKVSAFSNELNQLITNHVNTKGAIHGETSTTVGLGKKDNFAMGSIQEHIDGTRKDLFANPEGLSYLVENRVRIDPNVYVPAKAIPIASGGVFGEVSQITYHVNRNDAEQSARSPIEYIGESNWEFSTPQGMFIYPMMNNSSVLGIFTDNTTSSIKTLQTPWGGSKIRYYEKGIVARRTRPVTMTSDKKLGSGGGNMLQTGEMLFNRSSYQYLENSIVKVRSLNRNYHPFDVFDTGEEGLNPWPGMFASREDMLYHISVNMNLGETLEVEKRPMLDYIVNQKWPRSSSYPFDAKDRSRFDFTVNEYYPKEPGDPLNGPSRGIVDLGMNKLYPKNPVSRFRARFKEFIDRGLNALWPESRNSIYSNDELELIDMVVNKFWPFGRGTVTQQGEIIIELDFGIRSMLEKDYPFQNTGEDELVFTTNRKYGNQYTLPIHDKIQTKLRNTQQLGLNIKLKDLVEYNANDYGKLVKNIDKQRCQLVSFAWKNRLEGICVVRLSIGWYTVNRSNYVHTYLDLELQFNDNNGTVTTIIDVKTGPEWNPVKQELNSNLEVVTEGLFKMYPGDFKEAPTHPAILGGVFESQGGHIKSYNFYNRQFIGYYNHDVNGVLGFVNKGTEGITNPSKFSYNVQSVIPGDGFYGDHLRHIPVKIDSVGKTITYLTQTRDWHNNYRWAFVKVESDTPVVQIDGYVGPKRLSTKWVGNKRVFVPSMLIENDEDSVTMNISPMAFNTWNNYTAYTGYTLDESSDTHPIAGVNEVSLSNEITGWIKDHVIDWKKLSAQYFLMQGNLYWVIQTLDSKEVLLDNTDCFYGVIKNCIVNVSPEGLRTVVVNGSITANITVNKTNVNTKASLDVKTSGIFGFDALAGQDIYAMKVVNNATETKYDVMLNVAPFNNFYVEMKIEINKQTGEVVFRPKHDAIDPVFPYSTAIGYQIDYDTLNKYGVKIPHRVHVNYQSPVMLKKGLWSLRRTPNNYGFFTKSNGFVIINGRVMDKVPGVPLYPIGSAITIGGETLLVRKPITMWNSDFPTNDELFVTRNEQSEFVVYGRYNHKGLNIEPTYQSVPVGFINDHKFTYHGSDNTRNSLFPVFENKRISIENAGNSIPVFFGKPGMKLPKNKFFKN